MIAPTGVVEVGQHSVHVAKCDKKCQVDPETDGTHILANRRVVSHKIHMYIISGKHGRVAEDVTSIYPCTLVNKTLNIAT